MTLKERFALWLAKREALKTVVAWLESGLGRPLTKKEKKMWSAIIQAVFGNWKTTLAGVLKGIVVGVLVNHIPIGDAVHSALANILQMAGGAVAAAPFVIGGILQKDVNVTGGTVSQPTVPNAPSLPTK